MKKRSFRSTFVSVILVITVAISIVNLAVYGINIKKIRQVEVLKMKTAGERIDDMITISLNNIKGLKQICCTDNYARNILLKNNEKNDIGTKFENQNYMDNALKHIASMDTLILRATIVNKYGNIYCTDTSIPEEYVKTIRNMTKEWMLFEGKEDEYYYGGLQGDNANILTFLYPLHTYGNTPIALLAVDINYKTFQSILENAFYENSGECFILTGEQELFHIGEDLYQKEEKGYIFDKSQKMMKENLIVDTFQSKEVKGLDTPEALNALTFLYDLVVKDELSPNPAALTAMGKGADAMFRNQKVAMESAGLWMLPTYKENPLPFEWDVVRMPMDKNQNTKAGILNWGISKSTKNPEAAWDLLKFLCGPEGNRIVAESNMALPGSTDKEALQIVLDSKFPSNVKAFVDSVPDCDLKDQLSIYRTEVNTKVQQLVDEMLIGKSTPEETQEKLIKEINAILAN